MSTLQQQSSIISEVCSGKSRTALYVNTLYITLFYSSPLLLHHIVSTNKSLSSYTVSSNEMGNNSCKLELFKSLLTPTNNLSLSIKTTKSNTQQLRKKKPKQKTKQTNLVQNWDF